MKRVLLCWSSGRDSARALYLLRRPPEGDVAALLTAFSAAADRAAIDAVRPEPARAQARRAGLPLWPPDLPWPCSDAGYEARMPAVCMRAREAGIPAAAVGDLLPEDIRAYRVRQMRDAGLESLFPVRGIPTGRLALDMLAAGGRRSLR